MRRTVSFGVMAVVVATVLVTGAALASLGSGVSATLLARAAFIDNVDLKVTVQTDGSTKVAKVRSGDVVEQHIIIGPGGNTGWHTHPGPSVVLVKSGVATVYDGDDPSCAPKNYAAGSGFVDPGDGHIHMVRNEGAAVLITQAFQIIPTGAARRIDAVSPGNCPF